MHIMLNLVDMSPKIFLRLAGTTLITLGILGLTGVLGRISTAGFFHPPYWINYFHLGLGLTVSVVSFSQYKSFQVIFTLLASIMGITLGAAGLLLGGYIADKYNIPELRDPSDHLAHLMVGLTALWAIKNVKRF